MKNIYKHLLDKNAEILLLLSFSFNHIHNVKRYYNRSCCIYLSTKRLQMRQEANCPM